MRKFERKEVPHEHSINSMSLEERRAFDGLLLGWFYAELASTKKGQAAIMKAVSAADAETMRRRVFQKEKAK